MDAKLIEKSYEKHYGRLPQTVRLLEGGYRNRVYLCESESEDGCVIKIHRSNSYSDFYKNEVAAYLLLVGRGVRIPNLLFYDSEHNLLALSKIDGDVLQESQTLSYYRPALDLLRDSVSRLRTSGFDYNFFNRPPNSLVEGITMLNRTLGLNIEISAEYQKALSTCESATPIYNFGSFIPKNVMRTDLDFHIDLEMFSIGTETEDLAYFSLFSGVNPLLVFEEYFGSNRDMKSLELFKANILKLGHLTLGLYSRELKKGVGDPKKQVLFERVENILSALNTVNDKNVELLRGQLNAIYM